MLTTDNDFFRLTFPDAQAYLDAAQLRQECFFIAITKLRSIWEQKRLSELLNAPACQEYWFREKLRREASDRDSVEY